MTDTTPATETTDDAVVVKIDAVPRLCLRPTEAAAALGIGKTKLWEIAEDRSSGIPHIRFGKLVLYPVDELRRWISETWQGQMRKARR